MNKYAVLSMCILVLLAIPAVTTAALVGEENATMDNESNMTTMPGNMTGNQTANMTLVDVIGQNGNLTILAQAIGAANLTEALQTGGPYTVFAPNDEAFQALGNDTIGALVNDTANLTMILQYHVVEGNYTSEQLLMMLQNQTVNQTDNVTQNQTVNQTVNQTDNVTQNQTMDQNMTPQQATVMLQTLLGENLTVTLNQTTNEVMVNNATVVTADLNASNGVIHIIDAVLLPPNMTIESMTADNMTADNQTAPKGATFSLDGNTMTWINPA
ncbi:fasciclin domain-containing protein [Methanoculleus taiwanensis]|uniref:fasciclin domain-containing protein n=1 Tax=Methanoculleus taiwanensis TaxID=1550565 RepID=UPI000FFF14D7|nr:fasciclin domain-containing protein [Methanoculleus taiwanensis]